MKRLVLRLPLLAIAVIAIAFATRAEDPATNAPAAEETHAESAEFESHAESAKGAEK